MTNEEFEKRMEFLLAQQAQFSVDIQHLREAQAQTDAVVARLAQVTLAGFQDLGGKVNAIADAQIRTEETVSNLADKVNELGEKVNELGEKVNELGEKVNAITDAQIRTEERFPILEQRMRELAEAQAQTRAHLDQRMAELAEAQTDTDRRLSALIDIVREGRNGKS